MSLDPPPSPFVPHGHATKAPAETPPPSSPQAAFGTESVWNFILVYPLKINIEL
jgi:hypothetical protein